MGRAAKIAHHRCCQTHDGALRVQTFRFTISAARSSARPAPRRWPSATRSWSGARAPFRGGFPPIGASASMTPSTPNSANGSPLPLRAARPGPAPGTAMSPPPHPRRRSRPSVPENGSKSAYGKSRRSTTEGAAQYPLSRLAGKGWGEGEAAISSQKRPSSGASRHLLPQAGEGIALTRLPGHGAILTVLPTR
jgi:hypothetical protein